MLSRDAATISLWQETSSPYTPLNKELPGQTYDVIIVGAGITGISTALLLQQEGKKCLVLEAATDLCFGTTGGTTAHLNTLLDTPYKDIIRNFDLDTAKLIAQSTVDAIRQIKETVSNYNIDCGFETCSAFLFSKDEKQTEELDEIFKTLEQVGLPARYASEIPLPIAFQKAIVVEGQAKFHPIRYVRGMAAAFEKAGGVIRFNERVTKFTDKDAHVEVETEAGKFSGGKLIFATHIPPFINVLHLRCAPYRTYAMSVKLAAGDYPRDLAYDMYDPYHYYRMQRIDREDYMIIGGKDHKTAQESNTQASFLKLESHIRTYFKIEKITHAWSSQYYDSTDGIPYIGKLPGSSANVMVATGFGGNGMIYGTMASVVFRDVIAGKEDGLVAVFKPSRVKPVAGFKNFVEHNADVLKNFVSKILAVEKFHGLADLAPGDSKIIKVETQAVGIHKDDQGGLHAVNAICTHMKCTIAWNGAEKSWDCPCHGARFSCDGKVLNGPATRDLEYINIELITAGSPDSKHA